MGLSYLVESSERACKTDALAGSSDVACLSAASSLVCVCVGGGGGRGGKTGAPGGGRGVACLAGGSPLWGGGVGGGGGAAIRSHAEIVGKKCDNRHLQVVNEHFTSSVELARALFCS